MRIQLTVAIVSTAVMAASALAQERSGNARAAANPMPQSALAEFARRVSDYVELRKTLQSGLPGLTGSDDPAHVRSVELALAERIRAARPRARQGDIFTSEMAAAVRSILRAHMDAATLKTILDEVPGVFPHRVNDAYPKSRPLSTMPPNVLALLPRLPDDLQYRFIGGDLVLHDTKSNLIVDRIPEAISLATRSR